MSATRPKSKKVQPDDRWWQRLVRMHPVAHRSFPHEILDEGDHPHDDLFGTFRDMQRVNALLGGSSISLKGIQRLTGRIRPCDTVHLLDVGTGHADIPRAVFELLRTRRIGCNVVGLDLDHATLFTARQLPENLDLELAVANALNLPLGDDSVDIAMSSMTLHHFSDEEAVIALREMARVSRIGIIVNDLVRSLHGFAVAWLLGRIATRNRLTRHDAHRSIQRGRTEAELTDLARSAGLNPPVFDSVLGYRTAMTIGVQPWSM